MEGLVPSQLSTAVGGENAQAVPHSIVRLIPQARTGGRVSTSVMVWLQVAVFVQASVACQVRVAAKVFPQSRFVVVLKMIMETLVPLQLSLADGRSNVHCVPHSTVRFCAQTM